MTTPRTRVTGTIEAILEVIKAHSRLILSFWGAEMSRTPIWDPMIEVIDSSKYDSRDLGPARESCRPQRTREMVIRGFW